MTPPPQPRKPIPNFTVLSPQPPEDEPLTEFVQTPLGFWKQRYTRTGRLWLSVPWYFFWRKSLRCSLLEWLLFILAIGSSLGAIISAIIRHPASPALILILVPVLLQGHLWYFTAALYHQRLDPSNAARVPNGAYAALYLLLPTVICHAVALFLHAYFKK